MKTIAVILFMVFVISACSTSKNAQQEPESNQELIADYTTDPTVEEKIVKKETPSVAEPLIHTVVKGESLWVIAKHYGITVKDIINANEIENASLIKIGQQLVIPNK